VRVAVPHDDTLENAVRAARARADVVVVSAHWGDDFAAEPGTRRRALARTLIAAGADLIVGHGPHILHPIERVPSARGEAVVASSLGNLISPMGLRWRPGMVVDRGHPSPWHVDARARDGVLLRTAFAIPAPGRVSIDTLDAIPLWTDSSRVTRDVRAAPFDVRVIPLRDAPEEMVPLRRAAIAAAVGPAVPLVDPPQPDPAPVLAVPSPRH
jgi:poly-gamma-glutamate synthesis protein (capsule biosynthesis protein)